MYFKKNPTLFTYLFPSALWQIKESKKDQYYLTFDDGPDPESTEDLLNLLKEFNIKASFFCLGKKANNYPELISKIKEEGHTLGLHGYEHLSGWTSSKSAYIENVNRSYEIINSNLFRPPYGRITYRQYKALSKKYKIVMWDLLPGDFSPSVSAEMCLSRINKHIEKGSIIALHDSKKTINKLKYLIPKMYLKYGNSFHAIPDSE